MLKGFIEALADKDISKNSDPAALIDQLRIFLLFQEGTDPDGYGQEAPLHYLTAISHLKLACTSMKLFELKAENNG